MQCVFGCLLLLRSGLTRSVPAPSGVIFQVPSCLRDASNLQNIVSYIDKGGVGALSSLRE
jgi:hypothetical protein